MHTHTFRLEVLHLASVDTNYDVLRYTCDGCEDKLYYAITRPSFRKRKLPKLEAQSFEMQIRDKQREQK